MGGRREDGGSGGAPREGAVVWGGREECLGYLWGEGRGVPHCLRLSQWDWGAQMLKRSFWGVEKVFVALGGSSPAAGGGGVCVSVRTKLGLWVSPTVGDRAARHTVRRRGAGGVPAESAAAAAVPGLGARPASPGRRHRGLRQPPPRERRAPGPRGPGTVPRPPQTPQLGSPPSWGVHTGGGLRGGGSGMGHWLSPHSRNFPAPG